MAELISLSDKVVDKLVKIEQAKTLYNDLRRRIEDRSRIGHTHTANEITDLVEFVSTIPIGTAQKAIADSAGNEIIYTYATKTELNNSSSALYAEIMSEQGRAISQEDEIREDLTSEINTARANERDLSNLINEERSRAIATENELFGSISAESQRAVSAEEGISSSLASEVSRATASEASLTESVSEERGRATTAEASLAASLDTESSRATASEASLTEALSAENARATASEASLTEALSDENARATASEASLTESVSEERGRATTAEANIINSLTEETTRAKASEASLTEALSDENARAIASEASLTSSLASEASRAKEAEASLTSSLNEEVIRATAAETDLSTALDNEIDRATEAESSLSASLASETMRAKSSEASITTSLTTEASRAKASEASLATNLSNEVSRATASEASLASEASSALAAEASRAKASEASLTKKINTDIAQEVIDRNTAIDTAVNSLDYSGATTGYYVTQVTEENGVISVVRENKGTVSSGDAGLVDGNAVFTAIKTNEEEWETELAAEASRATASEASIASSLASETSRAKSSEASIASSLASEISRAKSSEASIASSLASETSRAKSSEASLVNVITSENTRATASEASLAGSISNVSSLLIGETVRATNAEAALSTSLNEETERAIGAEASLTDSISSVSSSLDDESSRAQSSESSLATAITAEYERARQKETELSNSITTESARAEASDASLAAAITSENTRAEAAESGLSTSIINETTRAEGAESSLSTAITDEVSRATASEASLAADISSEVSRATASEASLAADISSEVSRATASEASLATDITDEVSRATASEASLAADISSEVSRATASEASLAAAISESSEELASEASRAKEAEASLASDTASEASRAKASEASLATGISSEVSRATASEASLVADISSEASRAKASEASLATGISSEVSRATASEASLVADISSEVSRATASEASLTTVVTNETNRASTAESNLASRASAVEILIPAEATASNILADRSFVNSSISSNTANYISYYDPETGEYGPFPSIQALEAYSGTVTNNDYAFVTGIDETGNNFFDRYKATVDGGNISWAKEYRLNNSSFTAAQWNAINSGITSTLVGKITTNETAILSETTRATASEASLATAVINEGTRATASEASLATSITNEVSRAVEAEASLASTKYDTVTATGSGSLISSIEPTGTTLVVTKTAAYVHPTYEVEETTGTNAPSFGGTVSAISSVEVNELGHVTGYQIDTITIPDAVATTSAAGLMSANDKAKLDDIASGANKYVLPAATTGVLGGIVVGENLSITPEGVLNANPAVSVETTGTGNAVTELTAASGVVTATFGKTFSESDHTHSNYVSTVTAATGAGNVITSMSVNGNTLSYVKGITALTAHPSVTISADTTSTTSPGSAGTFSAIDSITRDSFGHVTKVDTVTVTMPTIPTSLPASDVTDVYSSTGTAPVSGKAVNAALQTLDVSAIGGNDSYITTISETDGKISASSATFSTAVKGIKVDVATAACSASSVEWTDVKNKVNASTDTVGIVSTGTQSFAGNKTFTNNVTIGDATFSYSTDGLDNILTISFGGAPVVRKPVGGKIYYIDSSATTGIYRFFDTNGNEVAAPVVGTDCSGWTYEVVGATKDRYYVFDDYSRGECRWTYYDDGAFVLNSIGGTSRNIGYGKSNTEIIMAADNGAYISSDSNGKPTAWYLLQQMRNELIGGCDDWYIPSVLEAEELRKAIGFEVLTTSDEPVVVPAGAVTGGNIPGTPDGQTHYKDYNTTRTCYPAETKFLSRYYWTSSEDSSSDARVWKTNRQIWNSNTKGDSMHFFGVRSF